MGIFIHSMGRLRATWRVERVCSLSLFGWTWNRKMLNSHLSLFSCRCFACFYLDRNNGTPSAIIRGYEQQHRLGFTNRTKLNILLIYLFMCVQCACDDLVAATHAQASAHDYVETHITVNIKCETMLFVFVSFGDWLSTFWMFTWGCMFLSSLVFVMEYGWAWWWSNRRLLCMRAGGSASDCRCWNLLPCLVVSIHWSDSGESQLIISQRFLLGCIDHE